MSKQESAGRRDKSIAGQFVTLGGERFYAIRNVDQMDPFFISVVSDSDHWLFVASNGGLTAGRVSPETALFPYKTVDQIYDSALNTGCKTLVRTTHENTDTVWEPFNREHNGRFDLHRHLYKNLLGDRLVFEEINADLGLTFRYSWATSNEFGFIRRAELINNTSSARELELLDGIINVLPAGTPRATQTAGSNLVDAYKWNEYDPATRLALYTLFSGITDRAEPCESLRATTVFSDGLEHATTCLSQSAIERFVKGQPLHDERHNRGVRGAYLQAWKTKLAEGETQAWTLVANVEQSQAEVVALRELLNGDQDTSAVIEASVDRGSDELARIMGASDALQHTAEENVSTHHYANVLFNVMRGGIFDENYRIPRAHFMRHLKRFNAPLAEHHQKSVATWPEALGLDELRTRIAKLNDPQLTRLGNEFLPLRFGRRHGDPSRPWNQFAIRLTDDQGQRLLAYQGNWRDIFQNWEALLYSFPDFVDNVIAKFVNASTVDGYNPYRITSDGIDWEVEDPDDPWSYIGYWGDHQIIYLLKLLELSEQFFPGRLSKGLRERVYSYANVPYRIKPFDDLVQDAANTVDYDADLAARIEQRVVAMGADGKLLPDNDGGVYQVTLLEKLLVPLLAKLSNLVVGGGIWLNTQRPEWNDANNALVGQGLSMVTLYYMRRYVCWFLQLVEDDEAHVELSAEVAGWLEDTGAALATARGDLQAGALAPSDRWGLLRALGTVASRYRHALYSIETFSGRREVPMATLRAMLADALCAIDHSIHCGRRDDGLYHAYNLLELDGPAVEVDTLYPMLEGQVAALSSGAVSPQEAVGLLQALYDSALYRADQHSFMLYPDRDLPSYLEKNRVPEKGVMQIPLLTAMIERDDKRLVERDRAGTWRFHPSLTNAGTLDQTLHALRDDYADTVDVSREALLELYEQVFNHKAFTGRSGGMFGFEGLGSIYWHMVSKLLLAVQEVYFTARETGAQSEICDQLAHYYYRVRDGIGFNKTPEQYGAFPTDPYSHTPKRAGAQQPGMTGQVKEEVLTRFAELGIRVRGGQVTFDPSLLRRQEFVSQSGALRYLDVEQRWQTMNVAPQSLAFTWCQVPVTYRLDDSVPAVVEVVGADDSRMRYDALAIPAAMSEHIFLRDGVVRSIEVSLRSEHILD